MKEPEKQQPFVESERNTLVAIGASAGGVKPIARLVKMLPSNFNGIAIIATHRTPGQPSLMKELLQFFSSMHVADATDNHPIECGAIYIGSPEERVRVDRDRLDVVVSTSKFARMTRIDELFFSVAESAGPNAIGVVLSGMLWDGVSGLKAIHEAGGYCIVQDPKDAIFRSMPENALAAVPVDFIGTPEGIAQKLIELTADRQCHST